MVRRRKTEILTSDSEPGEDHEQAPTPVQVTVPSSPADEAAGGTGEPAVAGGDGRPDALAELIRSQVQRAEANFQNIQWRSVAIAGFAGGFLTLLAGLLAVASSHQETALSSAATGHLKVALAGFVFSALVVLLINVPGWIQQPSIESMRRSLDGHAPGHWDRRVASQSLRYLESLRKNIRIRGWLLIVAILAQIVAIGELALVAYRLVSSLT